MGKKILKTAVAILALVILALVCWGLKVYYGWSAWVGVALFCAVVALVLGFNFVRRLVYRSRQRLRDALEKRKGKVRPAAPPVDIRSQWKAAIATLRQSSLRKRGDPVYVLPWYMVLGKKGSGKTTSLARARLASPIKEVHQSMIVDETRGIDWWYFDQSVVIDTSGRYATTDDPGEARDEWKQILTLLARTRRKEPLNGVVVTVAADMLQFASQDALAEDGRQIRNRIDELMRLFDTKFPVYLVVTKFDSLYGLDEWASRLPAKTLDQALGYCAGQDGMSSAEFLDQAFNSVLERLRDLRLVLSERFSSVGAGLLLLPNEFERLRGPLETFFSGAFGENPYLETPLLRGMFFCSGLQRGGITSFVLKDSSLPEQTVMLSGTAKGLFLHDLFDRIIPQDRNLSRPLGLFTRWERITKSAGYLAWMLGALAVGMAFTLAFTHNLGTVQKLTTEYPAAGAVAGKLDIDLDVLRRQHLVIRELQSRNAGWETSRTWLGDNVVALEERVRGNFVDHFRKNVLAKLDQQLAFNLTQITQSSGESGQSAFVQFVVRRLNMLQSRLDGNIDQQALAGMPAPSPAGTAVLRLAALQGADGLTPASAKAFNEVYAAYLAWSRDLHALESERDTLKKWLRQLALSEENLNWMAAWANEQADLQPVSLATFWPGEPKSDRAVTVEAAYTLRGLQAIQGFFKELDTAVAEPQTATARRKAFDTWYRARRYDAWRLFIENFESGRDAVYGEASWKALMPGMATLGSPYFQLLERVAGEFDAIEAALPGAPDWLRVARQLVAIKPVGRKNGIIDSAARATGVINGVGRQIIQGAIEQGPPRAKAVFDNQVEASKTYEVFQSELAKIAKEGVEGPGRAAKMSADFHLFSIDSSVKESSLHAAYAALARLKGLMGGETAENRAAWMLAGGPLDFMLAFVEEQSACVLQQEWTSKVFFATQGASSNADLNDQLYGAKGSVWAFANETARPFLQRNASEYVPVETLGTRLAFDGGFLQFVNDAMRQKLGQVEAQRKAEAGQKKEQLTQQAQQLDRQKKQVDKQKKQEALQRRQQEAQAQVRDVDQAIAEARQAGEQLRATSHAVTVNALPTGVNEGARANPFETALTVQCAPAPVTLNNFNFPVNMSLAWSEKTCGDTTLRIKLENLTLVRKYSGPQGFVRFLQEFYSGEHTFTPQDFPVQRARLEGLNVSSLSVRYTFGGHEPVLQQAEQLQALAKLERDKLQGRQRIEAQRERIEQQIAEEKQLELAEKTGDLAADKAEVATKIELLDKAPSPVVSSVPKRILACWDQAPRRSPMVGVPTAAVTRVVLPPPKPKPAPPPPKAPKSPAATTQGGPYSVQVGWFGGGAVSIVKRLREDGYTVSVHEGVTTSGQPSTRLRIGPFADLEAARAAAEKVDAAYKVQSLVIRSGSAPKTPAEKGAGAPAAPPPAAKGTDPAPKAATP
jgi:type VI secretion system protein ImpL